MKIILLLLCTLGYVLSASIIYPVTTYVRSPKDDSAIIEAARLNGNFAYRTVEGHAYKSYTPILKTVLSPSAITYKAHLSQMAYVN